MEDEQIIELYINRDERAIKETKDKYGSWIFNTALGVLGDFRDAAECENETYYKAWRRITDRSLRDLRAYLMRIARNVAYSVLRKKNAGKRKGMPMELHETDCGINVMTIERYMDSCEIKRVMNDYLNGVSAEKYVIFRLRYAKCISIAQIACTLDVSESKVKTTIYRMKADLRARFMKEGIII